MTTTRSEYWPKTPNARVVFASCRRGALQAMLSELAGHLDDVGGTKKAEPMMSDNEQQIETLTSGALRVTELQIQESVQWIRLGVESIGALLVAVGVVIALVQLVRVIARPTGTYTGVRLTLARYLALALEFQLGADILSTAVAPTWNQIGKLGAIAVIRTALNFFLSREMRQERDEREMEAAKEEAKRAAEHG